MQLARSEAQVARHVVALPGWWVLASHLQQFAATPLTGFVSASTSTRGRVPASREYRTSTRMAPTSTGRNAVQLSKEANLTETCLGNYEYVLLYVV